MMTYKFGDIVLIYFFQSASHQIKKRPALVILDIGDNDLLLAPITTKERIGLGDYKIKEWKSCGLLKQSWVRLAKIACLDKKDIECNLGILTEYDKNIICHIWSQLYLLNN